MNPPIAIAAFAALDERGQRAHLDSCASGEAELLRLGDEAEQAVAGDPASAANWLVRLRELARSIDSPSAAARSARGEVLATAYLGRLEEATALARQARDEALAAGAMVEAARLRLAAMQPLLKSGRVDEAIAEGLAAAGELSELGQPALAARAEINLGNVLKAVGRHDEALGHLDAAFAALADDPALAATIENTRGESLLQLDRIDDARHAFGRAIAHFESVDHRFAWAVAEGNLADLAARAGALAEALERFAAARARMPSQAEGHAARLLLEEGEAFEASGLVEVALDRFAEARSRIERLGLAFEAARAARAIARACIALGRDEQALAALDSNAPKHTAIEASAVAIEAVARAGIASRSAGDGERAAAIDAVSRCERAIGDAGSRFDAVLATHMLAMALERLGRTGEALAAARRASAAAEDLSLATAIAACGSLRARLARRQGQLAEAVDAARIAVAAVERTRASFGADRLRSAFLGARLDAYEELVLGLLEAGGDRAVEEAFEVAELARSRTLLERLFGSMPASIEDAGGDAEIVRLRERLQGLHARLASAARDDARSVAIDPLRIELARTETALERRLAERSGDAAPRRAGERGSEAVDRRRWRSVLAEDQAIVEYFEAAGRMLAFVARRDSVEVTELPADPAAIDDTIAKLHFRIRRALRGGVDPVGTTALVERLASWIWAPVRNAIGDATRLIVSPHGAMHAVPFAAIAAALGDRPTSISIVPGASAWARLAGDSSRLRAIPGEVLLVGVADAAAPRIDAEIAAVESALEGHRKVRILLGEQATASAVAEALAAPAIEVAHLACHGQFMPDAPHASGLKLADRWLSVRELAALPRTPQSVVLSGCDTGSVAVMPGEEILGLPRAFLAGGTRRLLGSLWSVGDRDTCELMVDLHRRWSTVDREARRPSLAAALTEAQRSRESADPHPARWASFIAIGDAS
ncbi:MAG: CHAT domain-containing protein [Phycisphaerales bacterium]